MTSDSPGTSALKKLAQLLEQETNDSLALLHRTDDNPICSITYDQPTAAIFVEWHSYATSTQLRFIHERVIQMMAERGACKILGDDSRLATIHAEDQRWIVEDWVPRAKAAGLRIIAATKPKSYFGQRSVERVQSVLPQDIVVSSFDDLEAARAWLSSVP